MNQRQIQVTIFLSGTHVRIKTNHIFLQVKEYCPLVFLNLQKHFSNNDACYLKSLTKFPLKLYLKACPCIYGTILTIKFTSIISSLQVKEYCPLVFRNLRKRFGIDDACYLKSLTKAPQPMEPPTGRSGGAKFYTSQDHIYTIKACPCFQSSKI